MHGARGAILAWLVLAATLAGCGAKAPPATSTATAGNQMRVAGFVESDTLLPLGNATVAIAARNLTVRTDDLGNFAFPPLPPQVYSVEASHAGYRPLALVARPETNPGALDFVLQGGLTLLPRQEQFHFRGLLDCGYVAPVRSGSCDNGAGVLGNQTEFTFPLTLDWRTAVVDVLFDQMANPGLDGLRLAVSGHGPRNGPGAYSPYGTFHNKTSFTARLEPNATNPGGVPIGVNTSSVLLDVAPEGLAGGQAGAGANIQFDLYVTVFYVTPAPAGFTLRPDA